MLRRKLLYLLGIGLVLFLNMMYVEYQFLSLLIFILIVPAASLIMLLLSRINFNIKADFSQKIVEKGQKAYVNIHVFGTTTVLCNSTEANCKITYSDSKSGKHNKLDIPTRLVVSSNHCRVASVWIGKFKSYDLLKLFSLKKSCEFKGEIAFFPHLDKDVSLSDYFPMDESESDIRKYENIYREQSDGVRDYMQGDRLNTVHWKLSASKDELLVRDYSDVTPAGIVIFFDTSYSDADVWDKKYQIAYSLGYASVCHERTASFAAWNDEKHELEIITFNDEAQLNSALISLMKIKCCDGAKQLGHNALWESGICEKSLHVTVDDEMVNIYEKNNEV